MVRLSKIVIFGDFVIKFRQMFNNNSLLRRFNKAKREEVLHSSAYAEAQNAGKIGATGAQTFSERLRIEEQRKLVGKYRDALVGQQITRRRMARKSENAEKADGVKAAKNEEAKETTEKAKTAETGKVKLTNFVANSTKPDIKPHF